MITRERIKVSGNVLSISNIELFSERQTRSKPGKRDSVERFSDQSAARMRRYLREAKAKYTTMLTLTYPLSFDVTGPKAKDDLRRFIQECKRHHGRYYKKVTCWGMFWFMEFTTAGQIHFHIFCTARIPKEWVAKTWFRITKTNVDEHLAAGTRIEAIRSKKGGLQSYAAKYANKQSQKDVPEGFVGCGRFWGISGEKGRMAAVTLIDRDSVLSKKQQEGILKLWGLIKSGISKDGAKRIKDYEKFGVIVQVYPVDWCPQLVMDCIEEINNGDC